MQLRMGVASLIPAYSWIQQLACCETIITSQMRLPHTCRPSIQRLYAWLFLKTNKKERSPVKRVKMLRLNGLLINSISKCSTRNAHTGGNMVLITDEALKLLSISNITVISAEMCSSTYIWSVVQDSFIFFSNMYIIHNNMLPKDFKSRFQFVFWIFLHVALLFFR